MEWSGLVNRTQQEDELPAFESGGGGGVVDDDNDRDGDPRPDQPSMGSWICEDTARNSQSRRSGMRDMTENTSKTNNLSLFMGLR